MRDNSPSPKGDEPVPGREAKPKPAKLVPDRFRRIEEHHEVIGGPPEGVDYRRRPFGRCGMIAVGDDLRVFIGLYN